MKKIMGNVGRIFLTFAVAISMFSGLKTYSQAAGTTNDTVVIDFSKNRTKQYSGIAVESATLDKAEFWNGLNDDQRDVVFLNSLVYYNRLFKVLNPDGSEAAFNGVKSSGNGSYEIDKNNNQYIKFTSSGSGAQSSLHADDNSSGVYEVELDYKKIAASTPAGKDHDADTKMPFYVLERYGVTSVKQKPDGTFAGSFKLRIVFGDAVVKVEAPAVGTEFEVDGLGFTVTSADEVEFTGAANRKVKKVEIPDEVEYQKTKFKVTSVGNKALCGYKKLKSVTVGKNVTRIGKAAFSKSRKLKSVKISSAALTEIGKKAFNKNSKNLTVKVPKAQFKAYKKLFKKEKLSSVKLKKMK